MTFVSSPLLGYSVMVMSLFVLQLVKLIKQILNTTIKINVLEK